MEQTDLFLGLAGIAGVFVGFGALISFTGGAEMGSPQLQRIRGAVSIGLLVIVAALIPVGLASYELSERTIWLTSSLIFLALLWFVTIQGMSRPENRAVLESNTRAQSLFFWLALELPIHAPLLLAVFGVATRLDAAFYTTALVFQLFEGAFVLAQLVYSQVRTTDS